MSEIQIFIAALLVSVALLNAVANWLQVPYPIVLVVGGLALGLVPGTPEVELPPDLVLLIFLPPLLYSGAFFADLTALRRDARVVSLLSIGLVLATTAAVAVLAHEVFGLLEGESLVNDVSALVTYASPSPPSASSGRSAPRR